MKKLIFFFLLLSSMFAIWNCGTKPGPGNATIKPRASMRLISLADLALLAKIRGSDPNKPDSELIQEISVLHKLDAEFRSQINTINQQIQNSPNAQAGLFDTFLATRAVLYAEPGCCSCGTGCCNSCGGGGGSDTTGYVMTVAAVKEINTVSMSPKASEVMLIQPADSVNSVRLYNFDMSKPGLYQLTINTPLRPGKPIGVQIEIRDKKFMFLEFGQQ